MFIEIPPIRSESIKLPSKTESTTNSLKSVVTNVSKPNSNLLMEEMLFEEEQKQNPIRTIDLDSLTIPETSTQKLVNKEKPIIVTSTISKPTTTTTVTTTTSPTKIPYTLYKVPHTNHTTPPRSLSHKKQTKKDTRMSHISLFFHIFSF